MALPPLELFSLRKELPCCRAALSVFDANRCAASSSSIVCFPRPIPRAGIYPPARSTRVPHASHSQRSRVGTLEHRASAPQFGQMGGSNSGSSVLDSSMMSCGIGLRGNLARLLKLIGRNEHLELAQNSLVPDYECIASRSVRSSSQFLPASVPRRSATPASASSHSHSDVFHVYSC